MNAGSLVPLRSSLGAGVTMNRLEGQELPFTFLRNKVQSRSQFHFFPDQKRVPVLASQRSTISIRDKGIHPVFIYLRVLILTSPSQVLHAGVQLPTSQTGSLFWRWGWVYATDNSQGDEMNFLTMMSPEKRREHAMAS